MAEVEEGEGEEDVIEKMGEEKEDQELMLEEGLVGTEQLMEMKLEKKEEKDLRLGKGRRVELGESFGVGLVVPKTLNEV